VLWCVRDTHRFFGRGICMFFEGVRGFIEILNS
jgi:hypothetical protein